MHLIFKFLLDASDFRIDQYTNICVNKREIEKDFSSYYTYWYLMCLWMLFKQLYEYNLINISEFFTVTIYQILLWKKRKLETYCT